MTGVPIDYFELPTKDTVLHRITVAPDEEESVWFTEVQSDHLGTTFTFKERNFNSTTKHEKEDDVQQEGGDSSRKRARTLVTLACNLKTFLVLRLFEWPKKGTGPSYFFLVQRFDFKK